MTTRRVIRVAAPIILVSLIASACSGSVSFSIGGQSPEDAAESLIEGELSDQAGVELAAACDDLEDPGEGDSFNCTGTTPDGRIIEFVVDIGEDEVFANSTNLLVPDAVPDFEQSVIDALNANAGLNLPAGSLDCGDGALIVPQDKNVVCRLSDPNSTDIYDTTITITDQANWRFDISVADEPT